MINLINFSEPAPQPAAEGHRHTEHHGPKSREVYCRPCIIMPELVADDVGKNLHVVPEQSAVCERRFFFALRVELTQEFFYVRE